MVRSWSASCCQCVHWPSDAVHVARAIREIVETGRTEHNHRGDGMKPLFDCALADIDCRTGGPARYVCVAETCGRLGFITPLTHNFCASCNRVRVTCTGTLYMCLGQEDAAELRTPLRALRGNETRF
jgi:molybdenum cofactor biosynthesis enzyme MoaA